MAEGPATTWMPPETGASSSLAGRGQAVHGLHQRPGKLVQVLPGRGERDAGASPVEQHGLELVFQFPNVE